MRDPEEIWKGLSDAERQQIKDIVRINADASKCFLCSWIVRKVHPRTSSGEELFPRAARILHSLIESGIEVAEKRHD